MDVHRLKLELVSSVTQVGSKHRLPLSLPRAARSQLELQVGIPDAQVSVDSSTTTRYRTEPAGGDATRITVDGIGGETQITWQEGRAEGQAVPPVLEVHGAVVARVIGRNQVIADARLDVFSYGGSIDSFQVRLPPRMRLMSQSGTREYRLTPVAGGRESPEEGQIIEVKLVEPADVIKGVHLKAVLLNAPEAQRSAAPPLTAGDEEHSEPVQLGGFEVLGADIQFGHIDLEIEGDWSLRWDEGAHVRRTDQATDASLARFEYSRQPFWLTIQVLPKERRISVEPSYEVLVQPGRLQLTGVLRYRIRGARAYYVDIEGNGWQIDQVGSENVVQLNAIDYSRNPLTVPLLPQVVPGEFELRFTATQPLPADVEQVTFTLPEPLGGNVAPATLTVRAAENVELMPRSTAIQGLESQPAPTSGEFASGTGESWYYRQRPAGDGPPQFVAGFRKRVRSISVDLDGFVQVERNQVEVEQRLSYRIAYEPLDYLQVLVPRELIQRDLRFYLADSSQPLTWITDPNAEEESQVPVEVHVGERLGECELVARYNLPLDELDAEQATEVTVPLVMPETEAAVIGRNVLELRYADGVFAEAASSRWNTSNDPDPATWQSPSVLLSTGTVQDSLPLQIRATQRGDGALELDRAWVQTWLTHRLRRDRATFRLRTHQQRLVFQIDPRARLQKVAVDQQPVNVPPADESGRFVLELPAETPGDHVVEFWYEVSAALPSWQTARVTLPTLQGARGAQRWYWQLITPADVHLVNAPRELMPQLEWYWQGTFWGRRSALEQEDLEQFIGATRQDPLPSSINNYLYSSFGGLESVQVVLARRTLLVLCASLVALTAGVLLIYFPVLRHPLLLLVLAVGIFAVGLVLPGPALLAAQAAGLGILLGLIARLMQWLVLQRRFRRTVFHGSSVMADSRVMEEAAAAEYGSSRVTTATAPISMQLSNPESKS